MLGRGSPRLATGPAAGTHMRSGKGAGGRPAKAAPSLGSLQCDSVSETGRTWPSHQAPGEGCSSNSAPEFSPRKCSAYGKPHLFPVEPLPLRLAFGVRRWKPDILPCVFELSLGQRTSLSTISGCYNHYMCYYI